MGAYLKAFVTIGLAGSFALACTDDDGLLPERPWPQTAAPDAGAAASSAFFPCDPNAQAPSAPIQRLAKAYVRNAMSELFSQLDDATRSQLMSALASALDLIPADAPKPYTSGDESVEQDHVDALFRLALATGSLIADTSQPYAGQMLRVCGAGAQRTALDDDACLSKFIAYYGRKAFRRPLSAAEIDDFKAGYQTTTAAGSDGVVALVGRFIAHPNFYYRFDSEGDVVTGTPGSDAIYRLTKWELLSKVTFLFWAAPPTDALYDKVLGMDLSVDESLASLVDEVLTDPKAKQGLLDFYREWLLLDNTLMPATDGNVLAGEALVHAAGLTSLPTTHRDDMIQEVLDLADHYTLATEGKLDDILESPYSFAKTPALATIYGVDPWDGTSDHLVSFPKGQRSGLITRAAMVASNSEYTRPIIKGVRIKRRLLCTPTPPPPPTVSVKPLVHSPDKTTRQSIEELTADPSCHSCHVSFDALGFLSENYDPVGRFRDKESHFKDMTADVVSTLPVSTGAAYAVADRDTKNLADAVDLGAQLSASGQVHTCMVRNYFEFVRGRQEDDQVDGCDL